MSKHDFFIVEDMLKIFKISKPTLMLRIADGIIPNYMNEHEVKKLGDCRKWDKSAVMECKNNEWKEYLKSKKKKK